MPFTERGFTLLELLVILGIIALIASILFVSIGGDPTKEARDSERMQNVRTIRQAINNYFLLYGGFPHNSDDDCSGWDAGYISPQDTDTFLKPLVEGSVLPHVPGDPRYTSCNGISPGSKTPILYQRFSAGANGCSSALGEYYVVGIVNLETDSVSKANCSFSCSGHDWSNEFDCPLGSFEYGKE